MLSMMRRILILGGGFVGARNRVTLLGEWVLSYFASRIVADIT